MNKKSNGQFRMIRARYWLNAGTRLVLGGVLALGLRGSAQTLTTNNMPVGANGAAPIASVKDAIPYANPFACAIVDRPAINLPEQGPWTISDSDLKQPLNITLDLVKHSDPMFLFLWNLLSSDTRSSLDGEKAHIHSGANSGRSYVPGPGIKVLVANLNQLIQGKLIYDEQAFARIKPYFSGDTVKLLDQSHGTNVARLNRLLLEEAFPLDIMRRPKILFDTNSLDYIFVDFAETTVSLYGQDGGRKWTADLGPALDRESRIYPYNRVRHIPASQSNVGLWNVIPRPDMLRVHVMGVTSFRIDLDTGQVRLLPHA